MMAKKYLRALISATTEEDQVKRIANYKELREKVLCMIKKIFRWFLGILFIATGIAHFWISSAYVKIMPPYIPFHLAMVYLSGVFEVLFGIGVLLPKTARVSGWGLILLLIAIFPANLHMALHPDQFLKIPKWALLARLPFQGVFILWVFLVTIQREVPKFRGKILVSTDQEI